MSRIESAKRRAGGVKRALTVLAAAGLIVTGLLARATIPGHAAAATPATGSSSSVQSSESESQSSDDFSIAPSTSQPQVQTHVS